MPDIEMPQTIVVPDGDTPEEYSAKLILLSGEDGVDGGLVYRDIEAHEVKADDQERTIKAIISSSSVDRHRHAMLQKGGDRTNYRKNPVVLWNHDASEMPIARSLREKVIDKGTATMAVAQFHMKTQRSADAYTLLKDGYLNTFSIGFDPFGVKGNFGPPTDEEKRNDPTLKSADLVFRKWELLEYSVVPVPANADALRRAFAKHEIQLGEETAYLLGVDSGYVHRVSLNKLTPKFKRVEAPTLVRKGYSKKRLAEEIEMQTKDAIAVALGSIVSRD